MNRNIWSGKQVQMQIVALHYTTNIYISTSTFIHNYTQPLYIYKHCQKIGFNRALQLNRDLQIRQQIKLNCSFICYISCTSALFSLISQKNIISLKDTKCMFKLCLEFFFMFMLNSPFVILIYSLLSLFLFFTMTCRITKHYFVFNL